MIESFSEELLSPYASKALATTGPHGLNVVPVSSIRLVDNQIWLFDYFMNKTRENILSSSEVSLVYWYVMNGHQIKASAQYFSEGELFDEACVWVEKMHPGRTLNGLVVLTPTAVHDISLS